MNNLFADTGRLYLVVGIGAALYLWCALCMSRVFKKAGEKPWKAWIPVCNLYVLWRVGWNGKRFFQALAAVFIGAYLLDILTTFGGTPLLVGRIIDYAALALALALNVLMGIHLGHRFGKPTWFGAVLLGLLPFIGLAVIGFDGSDYVFNRDTAEETSVQNTNYRIPSMRERRAVTGYLFILPFIIGFLLFMVKPLVFSMQMSLNDVKIRPGGGVEMAWNNFNNYHYALQTDPNFNQYLVEEIGRMGVNTIATLVMSFVIAVILNQKFKGRIFCRIIFFLPVILSSGVLPGIESSNEFYNMMSDISNTVQNSSGVNISAALQNLLSVSGVAADVFDVIFQMIDAIYDIVMASGIQIIVFLSGLQSISPSLYEAADVEGCSAWESFWKITFPMVSPLLLVNCIYTIIDFFMKNDNAVIERINEIMYGVQMDLGLASAMSWLYFAVALAFIGISTFIITRAVKSYE